MIDFYKKMEFSIYLFTKHFTILVFSFLIFKQNIFAAKAPDIIAVNHQSREYVYLRGGGACSPCDVVLRKEAKEQSWFYVGEEISYKFCPENFKTLDDGYCLSADRNLITYEKAYIKNSGRLSLKNKCPKSFIHHTFHTHESKLKFCIPKECNIFQREFKLFIMYYKLAKKTAPLTIREIKDSFKNDNKVTSIVKLKDYLQAKLPAKQLKNISDKLFLWHRSIYNRHKKWVSSVVILEKQFDSIPERPLCFSNNTLKIKKSICPKNYLESHRFANKCEPNFFSSYTEIKYGTEKYKKLAICVPRNTPKCCNPSPGEPFCV